MQDTCDAGGMTNHMTGAWIPGDTLAARVVLVRRELGISQREAATQSGLTYGEWQSMEDGRSPRDLPAKIARIALAFDVDRDWLMWGGPLAPPAEPGGNAPLRSTTRRYVRAARAACLMTRWRRGP